MLRRLAIPLSLLAIVGVGSDVIGAAAPSVGACCVNQTSRLDSLINPNPGGGDEKFFATGTSGPPGIIFFVDNAKNLTGWPTKWPAAGCMVDGQNGIYAQIPVAGAAGTTTVVGLTGMTSSSVGRYLAFSKLTKNNLPVAPAKAAYFKVKSIISPESVVLETPTPLLAEVQIDGITPSDLLWDEEFCMVVNQGAAASMSAPVGGGLIRVTGLSGMTLASVGRFLNIERAGFAANQGSFRITALVNATTVDIQNAGGVVADALNGSIRWSESVNAMFQTTILGQSGVLASVIGGAALGQARITGLSNMSLSTVGRFLRLSGAQSAENNGDFQVVAYIDATTVDVMNAAAVTPDAKNGMISWVVLVSTAPPVAGCTDPTPMAGYLNALSPGYFPGRLYDGAFKAIDQRDTKWFNPLLDYDVPDNGYGADLKPSGGPINADTNGPLATWAVPGVMPPERSEYPVNTPTPQPWQAPASHAAACAGADITAPATCQLCLATKGFYIDVTPKTRRLTGNFLNYYAPKDSGSLILLSQLVNDLRDIRYSIVTTTQKSAASCWKSYGGGKTQQNCICHFDPFSPSCDKASPFEFNTASRQSVLNNLENNGQLQYSVGESYQCMDPLADILFASGRYLRSSPTNPPDGFLALFPGYTETPAGPANYFVEGNNAASKSVCFSCSFNAVLMLTASKPEGSIITLPPQITSQADETCTQCNIESTFPQAVPRQNFLKTAKFFWNNDLRGDYTGRQPLATYVVGFTDVKQDVNLGMRAAKIGGGKFYQATSTAKAKAAMLDAIHDIKARVSSFSSSAVSTVQTETTNQYAIIPKAVPDRSMPWSGKLYRFSQYSEFVWQNDRDGDGKYDSTFLVDKNDTIIHENAAGDFVSDTGTQAVPIWEAGAALYAKGHVNRKIFTVLDDNVAGGDGRFDDQDSRVEFKAANWDKLGPYMGVLGNVDSTGVRVCPDLTTRLQGSFLDKLGLDAPAAALEIFPFDPSIPLNPTTQVQLDRICVEAIIQYVRGQDLGDEDGDLNRKEARTTILGDIFHSSPTVVDIPAGKTVCTQGFNPQCVVTIMAEQDPSLAGIIDLTKLDKVVGPSCDGVSSPGKERSAYHAWRYDNRLRERTVLVGANDGMLHAFSDGKPTVRYKDGKVWCDPDGVPYTEVADAARTGEELWAFIPPDQLPRLFESVVLGHQYYVDGDIMVRDVWADDNGDGIKQKDEFHTMAIAAEGRGGTHYFALDMRYDSSGSLKDPNFRWMFPQPCSEESAEFGKTLFIIGGRPPPIGPVLLKAGGGADSFYPAVPTANVYRRTYGLSQKEYSMETWVAWLSGGWSPGLEKGRGVYMVDAYRGSVNGRKDNLIWKFAYKQAAKGTFEHLRRYLDTSMVAPVAMADFGDMDGPPGTATFTKRNNGFFDTGVVGNMAGDIWTLRFSRTGLKDAVTGLVTNWSGARNYGDYSAHRQIKGFSPIFYMAALVNRKQSDGKHSLYAYVGTGNRNALMDTEAGACRWDNPMACSKYQCGETRVNYQVQRPVISSDLAGTWSNQTFVFQHAWISDRYGDWPSLSGTGPTTPRESMMASMGTTAACGAPGVPSAMAQMNTACILNCPTDGGVLVSPGETHLPRVTCGANAGGDYSCYRTDNVTADVLTDLYVKPSVNQLSYIANWLTPGWLYNSGLNKFYAVKVYGGGSTAAYWDEAWAGSPYSGPSAWYKDYWRTLPWNLIDVSNPFNKATDINEGWMLPYLDCQKPNCVGAPSLKSLEHKTSSSAMVAPNGMVLWNTNNPMPSSASTGPCGGATTQAQGRLYAADWITGSPVSIPAFDGGRYMAVPAYSPPPAPLEGVQYQGTDPEAMSRIIAIAGIGTTITLEEKDNSSKSLYVLPISRQLHTCRHSNAAYCSQLSQ